MTKSPDISMKMEPLPALKMLLQSKPSGGMHGLTFDTGALIGLERRKFRMKAVWEAAKKNDQIITIPTVVIAEWWRAPPAEFQNMVASCIIEKLSLEVAKLAGMAIAACPGASVVDAIVMASAAQRGDIVYTSDMGDLTRLQAYFPSVRLLSA